VGEVLWDIRTHAMTADIVHLPQTRFGTQLQGNVIDHEHGCAMRQTHTVCTVAGLSDASETIALCMHVDELQNTLAQATKG